MKDHRSLTYAVSGGQALGSGASKGQQSIDDRGLAPPPVTYGEPLPLFDSNRGADTSARDIYGLWGRPALRAPCRPSAAGCLKLVCLAQPRERNLKKQKQGGRGGSLRRYLWARFAAPQASGREATRALRMPSASQPDTVPQPYGWLKSAEAADAAEDKAFGADRRGDEMPDWVANKQARLAKIREAKAELEAEARGKAAADTAREQAARENDDDTPPCNPPPAAPEPRAQRNFTDPESSILREARRQPIRLASRPHARTMTTRHLATRRRRRQNRGRSATSPIPKAASSPARRRDAGLGSQQAGAAGKDSRSQGRAGGGGERQGGSRYGSRAGRTRER